ncbi:MAG: COQ9 family protein, partial [Rhodospirillaceae bacterium]
MTDPVPPTETPDAVSPEDEAPIQEPDVSALTVMKDAIIAEALPNIPFDGWSMEALKAGAQMAGYDREAAQTCFPKGAIDAIVHFCDLADRLMIADLHELMLEQPELRLHERIRAAIRLRLSRWGGEKEAIRRASTILAMPGNIPTSLKVTYRTIDSMWFAAGDRSMDIAFYTKRLQLTGIYTATLFYWLEDHS